MKRFFPFVLVAAGTLIALTVLFLFTRPGGMPESVRAIDWRRIVGTMPEAPVEEIAV
jgi:hypothetical protein